jgi:hypothetical protein
VGPGLQVARGLQLEPEPAVEGEQVEHVVEEADAGRDLRLASVQIEAQADVRLLRLPVDLGSASHGHGRLLRH